jgi:hypothetical protein
MGHPEQPRDRPQDQGRQAQDLDDPSLDEEDEDEDEAEDDADDEAVDRVPNA